MSWVGATNANTRTMYDMCEAGRSAGQNVKAFDYTMYTGAVVAAAPCQIVPGYTTCLAHPSNRTSVEDMLWRGRLNTCNKN